MGYTTYAALYFYNALRIFETDILASRDVCLHFPHCVAGLLDLANAYCEMPLKRKCEQIICQGISVDNVAMLYAAAIKFEAKVSSKLAIVYLKPVSTNNWWSCDKP